MKTLIFINHIIGIRFDFLTKLGICRVRSSFRVTYQILKNGALREALTHPNTARLKTIRRLGVAQRNPTKAWKCWVLLRSTQPTLILFLAYPSIIVTHPTYLFKNLWDSPIVFLIISRVKNNYYFDSSWQQKTCNLSIHKWS